MLAISANRGAAQPPPPPVPAPASAPAPAVEPEATEANGLQLLTRGPIHEAFAQPVIFDPTPGPVIPKEPPAPVEEVPPAQKPEGADVQWIPGYWGWDDQRGDFIWISGLWRDVPPGRQWVPGYWSQVEGGFRWTPGLWASASQDQLQYLPAPPPSVESGPSSPPPSPDSNWAPGTWVWQDNRYAWQPGSWIPFQPDWVYNPAQYVSTPNGYLFNDGYWDRSLNDRGQTFAPVYFQQPLYRQPGYTYTPSLALLGTALASSLFVRPANHQYYFGDYYDANNFQSGIYPWYSFHQSRYGYDPLFTQYSTLQGRSNSNWLNDLHEQYRYRREHPEARPPQLYEQMRGRREGNNARDLVLARPIQQLATGSDTPHRFEQIDEARRRELAQRGAQLHAFREQRMRSEIAQARPQPAHEEAPRRLDLPRSPIAAIAHPGPNVEQAARERNRPVPPAAPVMPRPDPNIRPAAHGEGHPRFEPHPDRLPPEHLRPGQAFAAPHPPGGEVRRPPEPARQPAPAPRPERPKNEPRREPAKKGGR